MNMKNILVSVLMLLLSFIATAASEYKAYEMPRTQVIPIQNSESGGQYELYIKLPEDYLKDSDKTYPVIYFTDAIYHIEILSTATENIMEDVILVGISWQKDIEEAVKEKYGAHASRFKDYSFWKTSNPEHPLLQFGQASNHLAFIRNNVFSYVEQNYRTNPNNRSYFGYSLGGVFGAYILMTQPDTFKNYVLGSPSVHLLTKYKIEFADKKLNANVFISRGTLEEEELREPINEFVSLLKARNDNNLSIESAVIEGDHGTAFPMTGVRSVTWLSNLTKEDEFPVLKGPYLGQRPPGLIAEVFAPGIVSINGRYEGAVSFSPDLDEIYFAAKNKDKLTGIYFSKLGGNQWSAIEKADFTKGKKDQEIHPYVSPDGKRIYFTALNSDFSDNKIWYVNRSENAWSDAIKLDSPINDDEVFFPNQANNGDLYYFNLTKMKTYHAAYNNGGFPEANEVEIEAGLHHVFIAPNKDYLVVNGRNKAGGRKDNDLYVSFKAQDGTWATPINLGDAVNTNVNEKNPSITPDGKYLFFGRDEADEKANIYWVSTEIITTLKAAYLKP